MLSCLRCLKDCTQLNEVVFIEGGTIRLCATCNLQWEIRRREALVTFLQVGSAS